MRKIFEHHLAAPDARHKHEGWLENADGTAMLLGTPVGSRVFAKNGQLGDTGQRAEELAQELGIPVIAYQDLGPAIPFVGLRAAHKRLHPRHLPELANEYAAHLLPTLQSRSIGRLIMRLHSGAGPFGTQLARAWTTRADDIEVTHIGTSDIVGLRRMGFLRGYAEVRTHNKIIKNTPMEHRTPEGHPRNAVRDYLADVGVRGWTVFRGDISFKNLIAIGNDMPATAVRMHLPGHSINGPDAKSIYKKIIAAVHRPDGSAPFTLQYEEDDYHSSAYDNHTRNADFVRKLWGKN